MNEHLKSKALNAIVMLKKATEELEEVLEELAKKGQLDEENVFVAKVDLKQIRLKFINWYRKLIKDTPLGVFEQVANDKK